MTDETQQDAILIEFMGTGSALFKISMNGTVMPAQLMLVGDYLQTIGKAAILEQREMQKVAVPRTPEPKIFMPGQ